MSIKQTPSTGKKFVRFLAISTIVAFTVMTITGVMSPVNYIIFLVFVAVGYLNG